MNILDKIVEHKRYEVKKNKQLNPVTKLEESVYFHRSCYSLKDALCRGGIGLIAEFKRKSPSKGIINETVNVVEVTNSYVNAGASVLSVLTDELFFGGSNEYFIQARKANEIPILRKDFIIDEYQIVESKAIGADVILLIAAILDPVKIQHLATFSKERGLNVLLEVHNKEELLKNKDANVDAIGINNRNLNDFSVNIETSFQLADLIPKNVLKISESAISQPKTIIDLKKVGFEGFLIGETFMRSAHPGQSCREFIQQVKKLELVN